MMSGQNNRSNDRLLYAVGFLYFSVSNISRTLLSLGVPREIPYALFFLLLGLFFCKYFKTISLVDLFYYLIVGGILIPGVLKYGHYTNGREFVLSFFILFLPAYLFFRVFSQWPSVMEKCFIASGWYAAAYLLPYYAICIHGNANVEYSMAYAYWIAFPICVFVHCFLENRKKAFLFLALLMFATLALSGCRGALLLTTLFAVYETIGHWDKKISRTGILKSLLWITLIFLLAVNLNLILSLLGNFSGTSRNIRKMLEGNYFVSTTREPIYERCELLLEQRPGGYGPFASRWLIPDHNYPHSIKYELKLDFGKTVGSIVFILLYGITAFNVVVYRKSKLSVIVNYLAIVGMGSLMVSASYYYEIYVPAMIGLFVGHFVFPLASPMPNLALFRHSAASQKGPGDNAR